MDKQHEITIITSTALRGRLVGELPRLRRHIAARGAARGAVRDVDDVMQETLLRALQGAGTFDAGRPLWPWLRTIADRAAGAQRSPLDRWTEALDEEPACHADPAVEDGESLEAMLARLQPAERNVLERYYVHGESVTDISRALGVAEGTVQARMWRARKRLAIFAASIVPLVCVLILRVRSRPDLAPRSIQHAPLTLQTLQLPAPKLEAIEWKGDEPLIWSLEGATWADDDTQSE